MTTEQKTLAKRAPESPLMQWKEQLEAEKTQANLARALAGTGFTPASFAFTGYMLAARNERLLTVNRQKLWQGIYAAAECGLSLQPSMQHMHLVPFASDVSTIIGYQGFVFLTERSGLGVMGKPVLVFDRDVKERRFHYREGTGGFCWLDPVPKDPKEPRGELRYVFCTYDGKGGSKWAVLERDELLARREMSAGWRAFAAGKRKSSPWSITTDKQGNEVPPSGGEGGQWLAMCAKTACRDLAKWLPKAPDHWGHRMAKAQDVDAASEVGEDLAGVLDVTVIEETTKTANDRLKEKLGPPGEMTEAEKRAAIEAEFKQEGT
jgi:recombinational DNA repair protein RecT